MSEAFRRRLGPRGFSTPVSTWLGIWRRSARARPPERSAMSEHTFYDTVIFALSLNTVDRDHTSCRDLLDVDNGRIGWCIVLSAITRGEATLHEYLNQLEQRCAMQGVDWLEVGQESVGEMMRQKRAIK